jgi:hypothetical protein
MSNTSLSEGGVRSKAIPILGGILVIVAAFFVTLYALDWFSGPPTSPPGAGTTTPSASTSPSAAGSPVTQASAVADLPTLPTAGFAWIGISDLNAQVVGGTPAVSGTPIVRLVAVPASGPHTVAAQVGGLDKGRTYRIAVWVKPIAGANFEIEAGDHASTGASYGVGRFDLSTHKQSGTAAANPGSAPGPGDWQKVWIDLPTSTGQMFFALYVLQGGNNNFAGDGRMGVTLGGITLEPQG